MQVRVEQLPGLGRKLDFEIPAEEIKQKVSAKLKSVAQSASLPGFRPGKIPFNVVQQRFTPAVHHEIVEEMIRKCYVDAIKEKDLKPAGEPKVDLQQLDLEKPLTFSATIEVYPEIKIQTLAGDKLERKTVDINEKDLDEQIEKILERNAEHVVVERAAKMGDIAVIDFITTQDGKPLKMGDANDFEIKLGSKTLIPGFEEGLVGLKAGDEKKLHLTFPEDYVAKEVAGQKADFEVKVKTVKEARLPELNAEFVKKFGIENGDISAFRDKIKTQLQANVNDALSNILREQVFEGWLQKHDFPVPQALVMQQAKRLRDEFVQQLKNYTQSKDNIDLPHEPYEKNARKQVALGLLVQEFIEQQKLTVDRQRVQALLEKMAENYPNKQEFIQYYQRQNYLMRQIESRVIEDQVMDALLADATIIDTKLSYKQATEFLEAQEKEKRQQQST